MCVERGGKWKVVPLARLGLLAQETVVDFLQSILQTAIAVRKAEFDTCKPALNQKLPFPISVPKVGLFVTIKPCLPKPGSQCSSKSLFNTVN